MRYIPVDHSHMMHVSYGGYKLPGVYSGKSLLYFSITLVLNKGAEISAANKFSDEIINVAMLKF